MWKSHGKRNVSDKSTCSSTLHQCFIGEDHCITLPRGKPFPCVGAVLLMKDLVPHFSEESSMVEERLILKWFWYWYCWSMDELFILMVVVVWRSGSALVSINEVNLRRAQLIRGWVPCLGSISGAGHLSPYVTSHPGQLSLAIPSWVSVRTSSTRRNEHQPKGIDVLRLGDQFLGLPGIRFQFSSQIFFGVA